MGILRTPTAARYDGTKRGILILFVGGRERLPAKPPVHPDFEARTDGTAKHSSASRLRPATLGCTN